MSRRPSVARCAASRRPGAGRAVLAAFLLAPLPARALDADEAYAEASSTITSVGADVRLIRAAVKSGVESSRGPAQRIADAVMLLGSKDYDRAAIVLNEVVERYPDHPTAYPDGLSLLGEAYFRSKQYLSARRTFRLVLDRSTDPRFAAYMGKALGRMVDIALRTKDYSDLDAIFASMNRLPPTEVGGGLAYARGKALLVRRDFAGAKAALAAVPNRSEYQHQARYLLGLIAVKEATPPPPPELKPGDAPPPAPRGRYAAAIELFRQVTQLPPDSAEHRHVIDLAWMAIGRLFYESDQWLQAAEAYNHIDRTSPEFGTMLYELAWVYVRLGDADRAQRALEVLAIAEPNSVNIADGSLLRADLMLRAGQFDKSLKVYEGVRAQYDPMREKVDQFLGSTSDPAIYYDRLSQEDLETLDQGSILPPIAVLWAREAEDGPAAFAVIDDVQQCRELIKGANDLVERLSAVLSAPNRVRAFPELLAGEEKALSLLNRLARARLALGRGMDDVEGGALDGDLGQARATRRSLEARMSILPVSGGDFASREASAQKQWNSVSQALQRLTLQVDTLQATVNGLRRVLREAPQRGVVRDPSAIRRFEEELVQNERDIALYRKQMDELRKMITSGRVQVGFGDQRYVDDANARKAYRDALVREATLAAAGAGGGSLAAYARKITPLLGAADQAEARIEAVFQELEEQVRKRTEEIRATIARERSNLVGYGARLGELDQEARLVVGEVAMRNFGLVRDRLRNIVLRADVGITEQAWEVREEQMTRVRSLQVERAREEQLLNEELREVLDDSGEPEGP